MHTNGRNFFHFQGNHQDPLHPNLLTYLKIKKNLKRRVEKLPSSLDVFNADTKAIDVVDTPIEEGEEERLLSSSVKKEASSCDWLTFNVSFAADDDNTDENNVVISVLLLLFLLVVFSRDEILLEDEVVADDTVDANDVDDVALSNWMNRTSEKGEVGLSMAEVLLSIGIVGKVEASSC